MSSLAPLASNHPNSGLFWCSEEPKARAVLGLCLGNLLARATHSCLARRLYTLLLLGNQRVIFRRVRTPESTVWPVRAMALKYIWSPVISAAMNAKSPSNPLS